MLYDKLNIIYCMLLFIIPVGINSQNYNVAKIQKEDGLSQSSINCGIEDSHGFVWFGTNNGLNRYDGKEFVQFRHIHGDSTLVSFNNISNIAEDKNGFIWFSNHAGGLNKLDPRTGKCKRINIFDEGKKLNTFSQESLFTDSDGILWYCGLTSKQSQLIKVIKYYNYKTELFEIFKTGNKYIDYILENSMYRTDFFVGKDGDLIVKTHSWNPSKPFLNGIDFFSGYRTDKGDLLFLINPRKRIYKVLGKYEDYDFIKFLGKDENGNPLIQISKDKVPFKVIKLILNNFSYSETDFKIDNKWFQSRFDFNLFYFDNRLFATVKERNEKAINQKKLYNGLYQFDESGYLGFDQKFQIHSYSPIYLGQNIYHTNKIFSSINHIIWDYHDNGLLKISPNHKRINTFRKIRGNSNSISNNTIRSVFIDNDNDLWAGTFDGLNKYDKLNNRWKRFFIKKFDSDNKKNILNVIIDGENNNLILGTNDGVLRLNKKLGNLKNNNNMSVLPKEGIFVQGLLYDKKELWIGSLFGLLRNLSDSKTIKNYQTSQANSISDTRISIIFKDQNQNIWVGTQNGLNRYLPDIDGFKSYLHNPKDSNSICGNCIWSICEDKTGNLWLGVYGEGISKYNPKADNFTNITEAEGLPDHGIVSMVCDGNNNLWLGSVNGLIKYEQNTNKFTRFTANDGFQGDEYSFHSAAITSDNKLVFGGLNGLSIFSPNDLKSNPNIPKIFISKLFIGDRLVSYLIGDGDTIRKDWETDYLKIQFSAIDFVNPLLNQYAFKIDGFHKDWIYLGNQNSIILAAIEPGEYTLRIKASNNDGVWNEKGISLHLSIIPPYWLSSWFKILVFSVIFFTVFTVSGYLLWHNREKTLVKKRIITLQLQALQAQMNPHFIFNSLNAILNLIVQDDKSKAMLYLSKFSKLLRKIIERSRSSTITLEHEIENIQLYIELEQLRHDNKFQYSIIVDSVINQEEIIVPALILQSYIENSIKHGNIHKIENGKVEVIIKEFKNNLYIDIIDNGIGRTKTIEKSNISKNSHKSLGMEISKERLEVFNSEVFIIDLTDEKGVPEGTQVRIIIYNYKNRNG